jgi:hypothetical protein
MNYRRLDENVDLEFDLIDHMGDDWFKIGVCLGVGKEVTDIQKEQCSQFEKGSKMLQCWKHCRGRDATSEELYTKLLKCRRRDLADMLLKFVDDENTKSEFRRRSGAFSRNHHSRLHLQTVPSDLGGEVRRPNKVMHADIDGKRRSRDDQCLHELEREDSVKYNKFVYPKEQTAAFYEQCRSFERNQRLPGLFSKNLSRQQGKLKLMGKPKGTYLIRERNPDNPLEPHHRHTLMFVYVYQLKSNNKTFVLLKTIKILE